jgi:hypothetical protein
VELPKPFDSLEDFDFIANDRRKNQNITLTKIEPMNLLMISGEKIFLTFRLINGSGWLTSHHLILCEHKPSQLDTAVPKFYFLKNFQKAQINNCMLTAHFKSNGMAKIKLSLNSPSLLQEVKEYIEKASENHKPKPNPNKFSPSTDF